MEISLKQYNIEPNGVIHVGAGAGQMARYWYDEGVYQIVWIEKNHNIYKELYKNTSPFGMQQLHYIQELNDSNDNSLTNSVGFKTFWRRNIVDIDIETYDLLYVNTKHNANKIIDGFQDLLKYMKHIILHPCLSQEITEKRLKELGYNMILETNNHIIYEAQ
jgi:hypothetical protein